MCFSAPASFTASAVLAILGITLIRRTKSIRLFPLASFPIFFSIQQAAEGFVWLNHMNAPFAQSLYMFFAFSFWAVWSPLSLLIAENETRRKLLIIFFLGIGVASSLFFISVWTVANPVQYHSSIHYKLPENPTNFLLTILTHIALITPFFISSLKRIRIFASILVLVGAIILWIDQSIYASMWCFFTALASLGLFWVLPNRDNGA